MIKKLLIVYNKLSLPLKSSIWFTFANFLNMGISVISTPIFTRLLTAEEIGQVSVYNTWHSIISVIITLNLAYGVYEICLVDYEDDKHNMTSSLVMATILFISLATAIFIIFSDTITMMLRIEKRLFYIMLPDILCNAVITFWLTQNRFIYNYRSCIFVSIFLCITRIITSITFVSIFDYDKVFWRIFGNSLPFYLVGILLIFNIFSKGRECFNSKYWKFAINFNVVLIPHYLSGIILSSSDKIMISRLVGDDKAGIYSIAYTCASLITILFTSINSVFTPYVYRALKENKYLLIREKTNQLILLTICFAICLILLAPEAMLIFAPPSYYEGIWLIPPITAGVYMIFLYSLFSCIEFYYKENKFISVATITGALLNIILNYIFIPIFGYMVAAYTTLLGYIIMAIMHYIYYRKITPFPIFDMKNILKLIIVFFIISVAIMMLYPFPIIRIALMLIIVVLIIVKRKYIIDVFQNIKS